MTTTAHAGEVPLASSARSADEVLAGLDPEQLQVATALRGPVCVLAGAGTGKTRAITHRIAYGVHSGVYVPQHVLAVTFTARAAGELRTRLRSLGVAGVQARTFHAAALRQLSTSGRRPSAAPRPGCRSTRPRSSPMPRPRLRLSVDRAAVRDLSAEIEWAKVTHAHAARRTPSAARRAGHAEPGGFDLPTVARLLEVYEQVKTDRGVIDFEDVLLLTVGVLQEYPHVARGRPQPVPALRRRRVPGRERPAAAPARPLAGRPGRRLRRRRPQPDHLLLHRRLAGPPARVPSPPPGARPWCASSATTAPRRRSSALANALLAKATTVPSAPARLELVAQRPPGPAPGLTGTTTTPRRPRGSQRPCNVCSRRAPRRARSPSSTARTPSPSP